MKFYQLALGAPFFFRGKRYVKCAMSMAKDESGQGCVLLGETVVEPDGEPQLLPPEEGAQWKPPERPWFSYMSKAPPPT
jgi:hypothetical protein